MEYIYTDHSKYSTMERNLIHNKNKQRYILKLENDKEAYITYEMVDERMNLIFSFVPNELRGKKIGKELVDKTFKMLTEEGYEAIAMCSYIKQAELKSSIWKKNY